MHVATYENVFPNSKAAQEKIHAIENVYDIISTSIDRVDGKAIDNGQINYPVILKVEFWKLDDGEVVVPDPLNKNR